MDMFWIGMLLGAVASAFIIFAAILARAGSVERAMFCLNLAARARVDSELANKLNTILNLETYSDVTNSKLNDIATGGKELSEKIQKQNASATDTNESLRLLALLQSQARLVDFFKEDIEGADSSDVVHATKEIHRKVKLILNQYLDINTIMQNEEGEEVTIPVGFDPRQIQVIGNVTGNPPFRGILRHAGWKVTASRLPSGTTGDDPSVLQKAEIEIL